MEPGALTDRAGRSGWVAPAGAGAASRPAGRSVLLGLVLALAVAVRLNLLLRWPRRLGGDEAVVGLMSLGVLRGEFPSFFAEQGYLGAAEAYLDAVALAVGGPAALALKVPVLLMSCLFVLLTFLVGRELAGWAAGLFGALLVALPPPFLLTLGLRPMLAYMEVVLLGSLVLLLALRLLAAESSLGQLRLLLVLGLVSGLGWWINPLIGAYLVAAGLALLLGGRLGTPAGLGAALLGFLLGSLPFWTFGVLHPGRFLVIFGRGTQAPLEGLRKAGAMTLDVMALRGPHAAPVALGVAAGLVYAALVIVVSAAPWARRREPASDEGLRQGVLLLVGVTVALLAAFSVHGYANRPDVQRYLLPLYSVVPVLAGTALARLWTARRGLAVAAVSVLLAHAAVTYGQAARGYDAARRTDWWRPEPVVALLHAEGIAHAYAPWEIAPRLSFETGGRLVTADPYYYARMLPYTPWAAQVGSAPRVAYVLSPRVGVPPPLVEAGLKAVGAAYRRHDFGAFVVLNDLRPPFAGALASLAPVAWRAEASTSAAAPELAFDRDADTAWLAGAAGGPGTSFRLDLGRETAVGGVTLLPVRPRLGAPPGYLIELSRDGAVWEPVATALGPVHVEWREGQPRMGGRGRIDSRFSPRPARLIRITLTASRPDQWWGIAELFIFGVAVAPARAERETAVEVARGDGLQRARRWAEAAAAYRGALGLDRDSVEAHWGMLQVFDAAGLTPAGVLPERRLRVLEALGLLAEAAREVQRLRATPPSQGHRAADP